MLHPPVESAAQSRFRRKSEITALLTDFLKADIDHDLPKVPKAGLNAAIAGIGERQLDGGLIETKGFICLPFEHKGVGIPKSEIPLRH